LRGEPKANLLGGVFAGPYTGVQQIGSGLVSERYGYPNNSINLGFNERLVSYPSGVIGEAPAAQERDLFSPQSHLLIEPAIHKNPFKRDSFGVSPLPAASGYPSTSYAADITVDNIALMEQEFEQLRVKLERAKGHMERQHLSDLEAKQEALVKRLQELDSQQV
jgi:hypothetical protein